MSHGGGGAVAATNLAAVAKGAVRSALKAAAEKQRPDVDATGK
jgi:hypothetical protein